MIDVMWVGVVGCRDPESQWSETAGIRERGSVDEIFRAPLPCKM